MSDEKKEAWVLYDGQCPFCTRYVQWIRLRENLTVHLVDARQESELKAEATRRGYDLDRGMILKYGADFYAGDQAMNMLSLMSTPSDFFNRLMISIFSSGPRARCIYPALAAIRLAVVLALGRGRINNKKKVP